MKQENSSIQQRVGLFVFIGLVAFVISLFILGDDSALIKSYYPLKTKLQQVQGLREGSVVSLTGIKVGNVKRITFLEQENALELELDILEDFKERIRKGSMVSVRTQGALGDKYLYITPAALSEPRLEPGQYLLAEDDKDILGAIARRGQEIERIFDILDEMHLLMKRINGENRSGQIMTNLLQSSKSLKEVVSQTKDLVLDIRTNLPENGELKKSAKTLSSILEKVDRGEGTIGALVNDPSLHNRMKALFGGSPRTTHIKNLIRETIQKSERVNSDN